ncbi:MAG TPA: plastocyanin/azurin family copper-binding protein [Tepidisphaeraceae bacterium]|jgi:glucose/arabinose dehydrogenase/azurin|nr:plastocyanin/azurin family copper-binding protein [Tepidisphaeraceae bacterium]
MMNMTAKSNAARRIGRAAVVFSTLTVTASIYAMHRAHAQDAKAPAAAAAPASASSGPLSLKKGDHIAIVGNVIADRMQFDGWLETLITAQFPKDDLVFRDLAVSGDEVNTWHRSQDFGSRDEWLTRAQADVIFAFYGFNESFKGPEGLAQFKSDLDKFLKETATKNYSGKGAPRVVLFSPAFDEKTTNPDLPDPTVVNANVELYAAAMAEVAKANGVLYVDLTAPTKGLYADAAKAGHMLTTNGHYFTEEADKLLAPIMFRSIFDQSPPSGDLEKLRTAINAKNWEWHTRYRTIDGFNVYGGRSHEKYQSGKNGPMITNNVVMQGEMSQRDVMTANRDKVVWAAAEGKEIAPDDSNLPPVVKVETNHPGPNPDGSWPYLSGEAAIAKMTSAKGTKVNLFASEEQFPELINPLQMAWDTKGRLWVTVWRNYPERTPTSKIGDSVLIFEDTKGTGHADKCTHFIDDLNAPTGFQFYKDGILLMQAPDVWYVHCTDGTGHANVKERVLMGMDSADSHHTTNAMVYDPGGAVYLSDGVFHRTQVETATGPVRNYDAGIYRFFPRTGEFERYVPYGFANPHGRVFDYWGNDLITDATGNNTYFGPAFSGHLSDDHMKHAGMKEFWNRPSRPCPGTGILTSRAFPPEFQGNFLNCNVIGFQGIYRVKVTEEGSGLKGETLESLVSSSDENFRPSQVNVGPDGAVYFSDWSNDIIGHLQHHLRDPNRDHVHGRIYRMVYEGMPLMKPVKIDGQPIPALLELLKEPENQTRTLAKIELDKHPAAEVIAAVNQWIPTLDKKDPAYEHNMMEALWVHQWMNVVDLNLLKRMLRSPQPEARAAATRVLCYWRDRVPEALALIKIQASDENPRVRLEAIRAASFFPTAAAADAALAALKFPTDYYISYTLTETMRELEPYWKKSIASGQPIASDNPAGIEYIVGSIKTDDLLKLPHGEGILTAALVRPDLPDMQRVAVLAELAGLKKQGTLAVLLETLQSTRNNPTSQASLGKLLPMQPADDLKAVRDKLVALATNGSSPEVRDPAWAAIATADESLDKAWGQVEKSPLELTDLLNGIPYIFDPDIRTKAYAKVMPLLAPEMPADMVAAAKGQHATQGRYVRISLPRVGTLTLAEVQVFSHGQNVALGGKAKQSSISNAGDPGRAIDGNTDGSYASGTETHTRENEDHPWWEVDLGTEHSLDSVVVWNRSEGGGTFAKRLDGFTLTVYDKNHNEVFKSEGNPAPAESAKIVLGNDVMGSLRSAAIRAAVSMNKQQKSIFGALVLLIEKNEQVVPAARGIRALPRNMWDKSLAGPLANALVAWARTIPTDGRTSLEYAETVQFAGDLCGMLPPEEGAPLRKVLKDLRVAVFAVRTVREQMRYDTTRLVVEAGKPFEIILENGDMMPHNLAVVKPGTRAAVAAKSATMKPDDLDNQGRAFMPRTSDILAATKLVDPGQRATLKLTAPTQEGDYEYFCTYPGHWEIMWGRLIVTKDVDAYLAAHPDSALPAPAAHAGK